MNLPSPGVTYGTILRTNAAVTKRMENCIDLTGDSSDSDDKNTFKQVSPPCLKRRGSSKYMIETIAALSAP
jgi:hypothetical protein